MRIVFMGSPDLAVPSLEVVAKSGALAGVVTQPTRPRGRGLKPSPSAVALHCREMGITASTPSSVRTDEFLLWLRDLAPDLVVVVAYGKILPASVLAVPRLGCVNVHASLLPELRGAAPIQWAIARGYERTGVTLMQMDEGMDTGPVLLQKETEIGAGETAPALARRLSIMGAELLAWGIPGIERGDLVPRPQDESRATYAPLLRKEEGRVRWSMDAKQIADRVRGFQHWPGCYTSLGGHGIAITEAVSFEAAAAGDPGVVLAAGPEGIDVACGAGALRILRLKPEGKREMASAEYLAGRRIAVGEGFENKNRIQDTESSNRKKET